MSSLDSLPSLLSHGCQSRVKEAGAAQGLQSGVVLFFSPISQFLIEVNMVNPLEAGFSSL